MKLLAIFLFPLTCCYHAPIEYVGSSTVPAVQITCVNCDTTYEWMVKRKQELDDSIKLVEAQNKFLDSLRRSVDTVKWTPYYYKPKKKK